MRGGQGRTPTPRLRRVDRSSNVRKLCIGRPAGCGYLARHCYTFPGKAVAFIHDDCGSYSKYKCPACYTPWYHAVNARSTLPNLPASWRWSGASGTTPVCQALACASESAMLARTSVNALVVLPLHRSRSLRSRSHPAGSHVGPRAQQTVKTIERGAGTRVCPLRHQYAVGSSVQTPSRARAARMSVQDPLTTCRAGSPARFGGLAASRRPATGRKALPRLQRENHA